MIYDTEELDRTAACVGAVDLHDGHEPEREETPRRRRRMKTLVVAMQKGGVGKTTTCTHLGCLNAERGHRVVMLDLDTQGNLSTTLHQRHLGMAASELFASPAGATALLEKTPTHVNPDARLALDVIHADPALAQLAAQRPSQTVPNLSRALDALDTLGYDLCVIDTPPGIGTALLTSLSVADYLLCPIRIDQFSINGVAQMMSVVGNIRAKSNPDLRFLGIMPNEVRSSVPRQKKALKALRERYPNEVLPMAIGERDAIPEAIGRGRPVWSLPKSSARVAGREYRAMADHISDAMGMEVSR